MEKAKPSQFANRRVAKFYRSLYTTGDMEKWNTKGEKENRKDKVWSTRYPESREPSGRKID